METSNVERCIRELGYAIVPIKGTSMLPLLREGESQVQVIQRNGMPLKKGDVILYRREDGTWVLHRIVRFAEAGAYFVCGDHQWKAEEKVEDKQILAVMQGFFRGGHYVDAHTWWYRFYRCFWCGNLTVRRGCLGLLSLFERASHHT